MSRVFAISGSLRRSSMNSALLRAACELAPQGMKIEIYPDLAELPPYNEDVRVAGPPASVTALKQRVREADAVLIATPEYNYNVPGVLKNALDWISRPPAESPLLHKPAAILGASGGMGGTIRAQLALRQSFVLMDVPAMLRPEFLLPLATGKFDAEGELVHAETRQKLQAFLTSFAAWIVQQQPAKP